MSNKDIVGVLKATDSPLTMFALVILICNAVFALAAAELNDSQVMTYSMHMFLGIIGSFVAIAVWVPEALYHPRDIQEKKLFSKDYYRPRLMVTGIIILVLIIYIFFVNPKDIQKPSLAENGIPKTIQIRFLGKQYHYMLVVKEKNPG